MSLTPSHFEGQIPVFQPSLSQFTNFSAFISLLFPYGTQSGLVKIIPPTEWKAAVESTATEKLKSILIQTPIEQEFQGCDGCFTLYNIETSQSFSVSEFEKLANDAKYAAPENKTTLQLERNYWRMLRMGAPIYGADLPGSLLDDSITFWNFQNLPNILQSINRNLPGVTCPYLYFGMWKATFAWHLEDMNLYSVNYLHFGSEKQWYVIPPEYREKFEKLCKSLFPDEAHDCPSFLRHKMTLITPFLIEKNGIPVHKVLHKKGEIMITFPLAYHAGFNYGFNVAESVNFGVKSWIQIGAKADYCNCSEDTVRIDVKKLFQSNKLDEYGELKRKIVTIDMPLRRSKRRRKTKELAENQKPLKRKK